MIECPKCQNKNISFVSVVNSKKNDSVVATLSIIQIFATFISFVIGMFILSTASHDIKLFFQVITGTLELVESITNVATMAGDILVIKIATSIFSSLITIIIACGIIKLFLPYRTYSYQKCICRACEFQWEYTPPAGIDDIGSEHTKP